MNIEKFNEEFNNFTKQIGAFSIDSENFLYIDKIYIFSYDFPNISNDKPNDIFVKAVGGDR